MRAAGSVAILLSFLVPAGAFPQDPSHDKVLFVRDVLPILNHSCLKCHGPEKQKGGLRLDLREAGLRGGKSGRVIVPGNAAASRLIQLLVAPDEDERMPRNGPPLGREKIEILRRWIDQGAVWPDDKDIPNPRTEPHWAWKRPVRAGLPDVKSSHWVRTPIDAFIAADLEKRGIALPPPAPKHRLLRRVTLDLVGLPPTRDELRAFLADESPDAYEKVVDRLLASPQHGERWGRHWMDVWRYSDWHGRRKEVDMWNSWSTVWRWRDWIVRSLNEDKGYDRMVVEMLAGDEVAPEDDATIVATGFIVRNWFQQNYARWKRDLVEHAGKAFLGLTLNCALCHDHKYDPISQEDYFRFAAFFEPLELRQDRVPGEPDPGPFQKQVKGVRKPVRSGMIRVFDQTLDAETFVYLMGDDRQRSDKPPVAPGLPAFLGGSKPVIEPVDLPPAAYYPGLRRFVREEEIARVGKALAGVEPGGETEAARRAEIDSLRARIAADDARQGKAPEAGALAGEASRLERHANVLAAREKLAAERLALAKAREKAAGDAKAKAAVEQAEKACAAAEESVSAAEGALGKTSAEYAPVGPVYPARSTGRRSALARWITSRENPLAARVAVNHVWLRHFGRPLVESVSEFGRAGKKPTHPELLDWLAVEFMESGPSTPLGAGWKMKRLHRLIVTSSAYRADSAGGDEGARFPSRRAEAEVVRDAALHLADRMDLTVGGQELEGRENAASRRRSMYFSIYPEDGGQHPLLEFFDPPDTCDCYRRSASVVPQQALALTNSGFFVEQSRIVARILRERAGEEGFVTAAFEHLLSRPPTEAEAARCRDFLERQVDLYRRGEPPEPDPARRAGESLVRVLFNHNDFVTIR